MMVRPGIATVMVLLMTAGLGIYVPIRPAHAATFTVDSTLDEVDVVPGNGQCVSTPSGVCTLRAAIMEANGLGGAHTITLPAGTFTLTRAGTNEDGGANGDFDIFANLTITGAGSGSTIIDSNRIDRAFDAHASATSLSLSGLTIRNGGNSGIGGVVMAAGSLTANDLTVTQNTGVGLAAPSVNVTNSTVSANTGTAGIAGVSVTVTGTTVDGNSGLGIAATRGNVTITDSRITKNGGGACCGGYPTGPERADTMTIVRSAISGNTGGVAPLIADVAISLTDSIVSGNDSQDVGGVYSPEGTVTLRNSQVTDNKALTIGGISARDRVSLENSVVARNTGSGRGTGFGGVMVGGPIFLPSSQLAGTATLLNSTVTGNSGGTYGALGAGTIALTNSQVTNNVNLATGGGTGGIVSAQSLTLTNSAVTGNTGKGPGGGIQASGSVTLTNSTVSGNTAGGNGGGIAVGDGTTLSITNSTIANNSAPSGSGIYKLSGTATVRGTIIANNTGSANCFSATPVTSLGFNLDSGASCGFTAASDRSSTDPKLGPLANNGGPTQTHALSPGSPAIDAADPNTCSSTDQRGFARPLDGNGDGIAVCDAGAFEAPANTSPPPTSCSPRPDVRVTTTRSPDGRLQVTVTAQTGPGVTSNAVIQLQFGGAANAIIEAPGGPPNSSGPFDISPPAGSISYTFFLRRLAAGQGVQLPVTVVDSCGRWPTFVGGGPSAF
jgi:CSLREA domain-containing protein